MQTPEKTFTDLEIHFKSSTKKLIIPYRHLPVIIAAMGNRTPFVALKSVDEDVYMVVNVEDILFIHPAPPAPINVDL